MTTRRQWIAGSLASATGAQSRPPNVLVFLTDQESALLPGPVKTPNRDKLIAAGAVRFSHAFCNTPQCSPARGAILTGLEPHRNGVLTNIDGSSVGKSLPNTIPNIGSVFRGAGYRTGYFGKWHLGRGNDLTGFGFEHTELNGADEDVAGRAASWIREQKEPWLAFVSILNPHHIYDIPKIVKQVKPREGVRKPSSGLSNLENKPAEQQAFVDQDQGKLTRDFTAEDWVRYRSYYCDLVEKTDACLGITLNAASSNTIVLSSTDHGDQLGEHGLPFKGPFMYEELLRIPLLFAGPGVEKLRARSRDLVTQTDYAPTLAALAGLKWPVAVDGRDLTRTAPPREHLFLEYYAKQKWVNPIRTIRTRRYKLNWYDRGNKELYDLDQDPHELNNLAGNPAAAKQQAELERKLTAWRRPMV